MDDEDFNALVKQTQARANEILDDLLGAMARSTSSSPTNTLEALLASEMLASLNRRIARDQDVPLDIAKVIQRIASDVVGRTYKRIGGRDVVRQITLLMRADPDADAETWKRAGAAADDALGRIAASLRGEHGDN